MRTWSRSGFNTRVPKSCTAAISWLFNRLCTKYIQPYVESKWNMTHWVLCWNIKTMFKTSGERERGSKRKDWFLYISEGKYGFEPCISAKRDTTYSPTEKRVQTDILSNNSWHRVHAYSALFITEKENSLGLNQSLFWLNKRKKAEKKSCSSATQRAHKHIACCWQKWQAYSRRLDATFYPQQVGKMCIMNQGRSRIRENPPQLANRRYT